MKTISLSGIFLIVSLVALSPARVQAQQTAEPAADETTMATETEQLTTAEPATIVQTKQPADEPATTVQTKQPADEPATTVQTKQPAAEETVTTAGTDKSVDAGKTAPAENGSSPEQKIKNVKISASVEKDQAAEPVAPPTYWTSQGGAVDEPGTRSVDVHAGFPGLTVMFSMPVVQHLEIDPFFSINYWGSVMTTTPQISTNVGARLKLNGYRRGSLQIALMADLAFGVSLHPDNGFLMSLTFPQLVISGKVADKVHLFGGMKVPINLNVHPDFRLSVAFAGNFGAEFIITDNVHLFVMADAGPEIAWTFKQNPAPGDDSTETAIGAWLATSFGIAARF